MYAELQPKACWMADHDRPSDSSRITRARRTSPARSTASALAIAVPDVRAAKVGALFQAYRLITYVTFDFKVTVY